MARTCWRRGALLPERVHGVGVLGGVAPTRGEDAVDGGIIQLAVSAGAVPHVRPGAARHRADPEIRIIRPLAGPGLDLYAAVQPPGDKNLLSRPEFKAMFIDDLLNGSRFQTSAPINDLLLFTRDWGFSVADVTVPVRWWHGDDDHIVPFRHGEHVVERLPDATLKVIDGESHLGGLGIAEEVHLHAYGARPAPRRPAPQRRVPEEILGRYSPPLVSQWSPQLHTCATTRAYVPHLTSPLGKA